MRMGWQELLIILLIILVILGKSKLPALGDALGKCIRDFKRSFSGKDENDGPSATRDKPPDAGQGSDEEQGGGR